MTLLFKTEKLSKHGQQKNMTFCWKDLDHSQNNWDGLNQWSFVPLGPTLTYKTSNLNKFRKFLAANQCIDGNSWNNKNQHPLHDLPQTCGGSKSVCTGSIRPTENFQSHLRTSFSINERWSNKYYTHKLTTNKRRIEQKTWRIYLLKTTIYICWRILT